MRLKSQNLTEVVLQALAEAARFVMTTHVQEEYRLASNVLLEEMQPPLPSLSSPPQNHQTPATTTPATLAIVHLGTPATEACTTTTAAVTQLIPAKTVTCTNYLVPAQLCNFLVEAMENVMTGMITTTATHPIHGRNIATAKMATLARTAQFLHQLQHLPQHQKQTLAIPTPVSVATVPHGIPATAKVTATGADAQKDSRESTARCQKPPVHAHSTTLAGTTPLAPNGMTITTPHPQIHGSTTACAKLDFLELTALMRLLAIQTPA